MCVGGGGNVDGDLRIHCAVLVQMKRVFIANRAVYIHELWKL